MIGPLISELPEIVPPRHVPMMIGAVAGVLAHRQLEIQTTIPFYDAPASGWVDANCANDVEEVAKLMERMV